MRDVYNELKQSDLATTTVQSMWDTSATGLEQGIDKSQWGGGGGSLTLILVQVCRQDFSIRIRKKSLDPLRAKKIFIRKTEYGPHLGFSYKSLISDPIRSGKRSQMKIT